VPVVSIDFVLHPVRIGPVTGKERQPIAVFLDAFQFHRDRVGRDMLQRMTLLASGLYDVWSFTWSDVDAAFDSEVEKATLQLHPNAEALKAWLGKLQLGRWWDRLEAPVMRVFLDLLASPADPVPWHSLATASVLSQLGLVDAAGRQRWWRDVQAHAPPEALPWFEGVPENGVYLSRPTSATFPFVGMWAAVSREGARELTRTSDYRVLVWLDDRPEHQDTVDFRRAWNGYLHLLIYLRRLPHVWFVTSHEQNALDFGTLGSMRETGAEADRADRMDARAAHGGGLEAERSVAFTRWPVLDVAPAFRPLVQRLQSLGLPVPTVGIDLPDVRGYASGIEGELVWEAQAVAVVEVLPELRSGLPGGGSATSGPRPLAEGWSLFTLEALLENPAPLLQRLQSNAVSPRTQS